MQNFLIKVGVNAVAIWVATLVVPGVTVTSDGAARTVFTLLVLGLLFGLVNAVIKPVVKLLALPLYVLTLGLIAFVVNALMLQILEWLSGPLGIGFAIDHFFWSAVAAAIVVTFVSLVLNLALRDRD